ncbi:PTS glucose transporter subunit IIA, partial [Halalkalibacterium halodurans]|uniref:PTS sugar transporter subunit IIA n=1 Tax=Halalkalibacterium halodurans TaxID=86665 RepID=UPI002E1ADF8D|nr:PTS glucose transporter subunit IIA [Halalkalibacterium halodurans]
LTYLFGLKSGNASDEQTETKAHTSTGTGEKEEISSPFNGSVITLSEIKDEAFSSGALGEGIAIEPSEGKLFSPVSGMVTALYPTHHALGITTDRGAELLIHIGLDTVQLEGKFFTAHTIQGAQVEKGDLLIEFDIKEIKAAGYAVTTPVIVTNHKQYGQLFLTDKQQVNAGDRLLELTR